MKKLTIYKFTFIISLMTFLPNTAFSQIQFHIPEWIPYGQVPANRVCSSTENFQNKKTIYIQRCLTTETDAARGLKKSSIYTFIYNGAYQGTPYWRAFQVDDNNLAYYLGSWHWPNDPNGKATCGTKIFKPYEKMVCHTDLIYSKSGVENLLPWLFPATIGFSRVWIWQWDGSKWNYIGNSDGYTLSK